MTLPAPAWVPPIVLYPAPPDNPMPSLPLGRLCVPAWLGADQVPLDEVVRATRGPVGIVGIVGDVDAVVDRCPRSGCRSRASSRRSCCPMSSTEHAGSELEARIARVFRPLGKATVPVTSVPMKLPWTSGAAAAAADDDPASMLPEMMFPAPACSRRWCSPCRTGRARCPASCPGSWSRWHRSRCSCPR